MVSSVASVPAFAGVPAVAGVHALVYIPSVALTSFLLLAFPDVPAFSCAAVGLAVADVPILLLTALKSCGARVSAVATSSAL